MLNRCYQVKEVDQLTCAHNYFKRELRNQKYLKVRNQKWVQADILITKKNFGNHLTYDAMEVSYHLELGSPKRCGVWLQFIRTYGRKAIDYSFTRVFSRTHAELQCKDRITKTIGELFVICIMAGWHLYHTTKWENIMDDKIFKVEPFFKENPQ